MPVEKPMTRALIVRRVPSEWHVASYVDDEGLVVDCRYPARWYLTIHGKDRDGEYLCIGRSFDDFRSCDASDEAASIKRAIRAHIRFYASRDEMLAHGSSTEMPRQCWQCDPAGTRGLGMRCHLLTWNLDLRVLCELAKWEPFLLAVCK